MAFAPAPVMSSVSLHPAPLPGPVVHMATEQAPQTQPTASNLVLSRELSISDMHQAHMPTPLDNIIAGLMNEHAH